MRAGPTDWVPLRLALLRSSCRQAIFHKMTTATADGRSPLPLSIQLPYFLNR
jgi:hypothetical protein